MRHLHLKLFSVEMEIYDIGGRQRLLSIREEIHAMCDDSETLIPLLG